MSGRFPREQVYFALFFILWAAGCVVSHWVGRGVLEHAREQALVEVATAPGEPVAEQTVAEEGQRPAPAEAEAALMASDHRIQRAALMPLWNLPLFIGLGFIVREGAQAGPLYWSLVLLGSLYIPFFATLFAFFLFHAPRGMRGFPGVDDDPPKDDDDE